MSLTFIYGFELSFQTSAIFTNEFLHFRSLTNQGYSFNRSMTTICNHLTLDSDMYLPQQWMTEK